MSIVYDGYKIEIYVADQIQMVFVFDTKNDDEIVVVDNWEFGIDTTYRQIIAYVVKEINKIVPV